MTTPAEVPTLAEVGEAADQEMDPEALLAAEWSTTLVVEALLGAELVEAQ